MSDIISPILLVGETYPMQFNFGTFLAVGETISGATATAIVFSGTDNTPSTILSGSPTIASPIVTQNITNNTSSEGVIYEIICVVTTSATHVFSLKGYIAFTSPAGQYLGNGT